MSDIFWRTMPTPLGELTVAASLTAVVFAAWRAVPDPAWVFDPTGLTDVVTELTEYFAGTRHEFSIPTAGAGTEFQRRVWAELVQVRYGQTATYGQIAAALGKPTASRAVGAANGKNPVSIIVPCHRIIGASGTLTGYAGGVDRKKWLLELEQPAV